MLDLRKCYKGSLSNFLTCTLLSQALEQLGPLSPEGPCLWWSHQTSSSEVNLKACYCKAWQAFICKTTCKLQECGYLFENTFFAVWLSLPTPKLSSWQQQITALFSGRMTHRHHRLKAATLFSSFGIWKIVSSTHHIRRTFLYTVHRLLDVDALWQKRSLLVHAACSPVTTRWSAASVLQSGIFHFLEQNRVV